MLVFIPAYRCEPQIGRVLSQLAAIDQSWPVPIQEILVLDNQSPDGTLEAATQAALALKLGKVSVGRNVQNYGLGGSHKAAFQYALRKGYSHVVVLHGDDQGSIEDLRPAFASDDYLSHDACLGARFMRGSRLQNYSAFRTVGNRVFNLLFSLVGRRRVLDLGSGLNCYRVSSLESRYWWTFADDLTFNYYMVLAHLHRRDSIKFMPISWREDDQASNVKMTSQALRVLGLLAASALRGARFFQADHRTVRHAEYVFEIVLEGA